MNGIGGIIIAARIACRSFGGDDGMFNSAGFSNAVELVTGLCRPMDGRLVQFVLEDHHAIDRHGSAHWVLKKEYRQ